MLLSKWALLVLVYGSSCWSCPEVLKEHYAVAYYDSWVDCNIAAKQLNTDKQRHEFFCANGDTTKKAGD